MDTLAFQSQPRRVAICHFSHREARSQKSWIQVKICDRVSDEAKQTDAAARMRHAQALNLPSIASALSKELFAWYADMDAWLRLTG